MTEQQQIVARHALISGRVQGVGYRAWAARTAEAAGLTGWVRNLPDGRVELVTAGPAARVAEFLDACGDGPTFARVDKVDARPCEDPGLAGYEIRRG